MAAKNSNNKDGNNLSFNVKEIKDICSKYKKYIATGAMLILLAVVISSSRAASGNEGTPDNGPVSGADDSQENIEAFEIDAYPEVNALFEEYYGYYAAGDADSIEKIAFPITDTEKSYIKWYSKYIDQYDNIKCYSKKGVSDGEFIVMVTAETKYKDIKTKAPGVGTFYVRKDEEGACYIDNTYSQVNEVYRENTTDAKVDEFIAEFNQGEDVVSLGRDIQKDFDKALESDENLKELVTSTVPGAMAEWVATFSPDDKKAGDEGENKGTSSEQGSSNQTETRTAYVKSDGVNLRKSRSTGSDVLLSLDEGTKVTVYGESKDGWYKVKCKGKTGYVSEDYIVSENPKDKKPEEPASGSQTVKTRTAYVKSNGVNLRKRRSTSSDVLLSLDAGTKVTVYGESKDGWYKVKCKGKTGFVSEDYIVSDKSQVVDKRVAYAKESVNMRKSRSTDSEVIQTLKAGAKVMIYGRSKDGWFKIRSKGKFGYVKKEYIVTNKSKVIKDEPQQNTPSTPSYFNEGDRITLSDSVNVRQAMSEGSDRVGVAYQGDVLTVVMSYAEGWTKVSWNGQTGYVKTEYLR